MSTTSYLYIVRTNEKKTFYIACYFLLTDEFGNCLILTLIYSIFIQSRPQFDFIYYFILKVLLK